MFKKFTLFTCVLGFVCSIALSNTALAVSMPKSCPTLSELKNQKLVHAELDNQSGKYVAFDVGPYGTLNQWGFLIANIDASNAKKALVNANKALATLSGQPKKPVYNKEHSVWICVYGIDYGYIAAAITPLPSGKITHSLR